MAKHKPPFNPLLALLAALATLFFVFPLIGLITGAPWGHILSVITSKTALQAHRFAGQRTSSTPLASREPAPNFAFMIMKG